MAEETQVADAPVKEDTGQAPSEAVNQEFNFREHISEELREDPSLSGYKDINSMAKSLINAQKMVGADKVAIPGSWATDDDWAQVYSKLGRPDEAASYELDGGELVDETSMGRFKEMAHKAGLNAKQAQMIISGYTDMVTEANAQTQTQSEDKQVAMETELKRDWGERYDRNLAQANAVLDQFGGEEFTTETDLGNGQRLGDNKEIIKFLSKVGNFMHEKMGEDNFSGRDSEPGLKDSDIDAMIAKLTAPNTPYWDKNHPQHDIDVNEALRLRELRNG